MDWVLVAGIVMVGGGLFFAIRSATTEQPSAAIDRLEQLAAAADNNPLMARTSMAIAEAVPRSRWWREWMDQQAEKGGGKVEQFTKKNAQVADLLDRADLRLRPHEWFSILLGVGVVTAGICFLRFNLYVAVGTLFMIPTVGGQLYLRYRISKRLKTVDGQLSDVLMQMSNGLKAGYSFAQALAAVSGQARPPLGKDLTRVKTEMELGIPVDEALRHLAERVPTEDIDLVVTAVAVTRVLGGNLAQILELIASTVRERVKIQGEIRTLTAQARASGWIVTLLPVGLAIILTFIAPDYFNRMFKDPIGIGMMIGCGFSMLVGGLIIRKIVTIDV